jgi:NADH-quinone oxidoreductase subunit H
MIEFFTTQLGFSIALCVVILVLILTAVAYCILAERKVSAWIQDRVGPNRAGPLGLLQPIADGVKFLLKEEIIPANVDKPVFLLAPTLILFVALVGFVVIPWGGQVELNGNLLNVQVTSVDIGLLYLLAVTSMGVYGVVLGGWSSNNKYSFYGAMRATAQMLSYEIPMGLAILVVVLATGQLRLEHVVAAQVEHTWLIFYHPLAAFALLICMFAETNRAPFDLAEAEQELVGGYHTEYSGMKMAMFFLAEYTHMITNSALWVALFFGGWALPFSWTWLDESTTPMAALVRVGIYATKVAFCIFLYMWVRWTLPRFRFDQLMRLSWLGLVPQMTAVVLWAGVMLYWGRPMSWLGAVSGNALVLALTLVPIARRKGPITGRQAHLPPIAEPKWTTR